MRCFSPKYRFTRHGNYAIIHLYESAYMRTDSAWITISHMFFQCPQGEDLRGNRESGASPERSGHCERGDRPQLSIVPRHEKERPASAIRKSGNLLKKSAHSFRRKRLACLGRFRSTVAIAAPAFRKKGGRFYYGLSACCPAGPADPIKPAACRILCMDCRRAALRGSPTRPSLRLAESLWPAILI